MAISNATRLSDFGAGIGTQGAVIQVDNANKRLGVGTDNPQSTFQVGVGCSISSSGVGTFAHSVVVKPVVGAAFTANASGVTVSGVVTATTFSGGGGSLTGISTGVSINAAGGALQRVMLGNVTAGVANTMATTGSLYWNNSTSTLYATNVNISGTTTTEDVQNVDSTGIVTAGLGLRATKGGLVVTAGVSTFSAALDVNANVDAFNITAIGGNFTGILTAATVEGTTFAGDGSGLTGVGGEFDITSCLFV